MSYLYIGYYYPSITLSIFPDIVASVFRQFSPLYAHLINIINVQINTADMNYYTAVHNLFIRLGVN